VWKERGEGRRSVTLAHSRFAGWERGVVEERIQDELEKF